MDIAMRMVCTYKANRITWNINAMLHVSFLCLRLYFHEYVNFINNYSDSTLGWGGEREMNTTCKSSRCPAVCKERWDQVSDYLQKMKKKTEEILDQQVIKGHKEKMYKSTGTIVCLSIANHACREKAKTFIPN